MILLSFDIEEFDVPQEHGIDIAFEEQIRISSEGTIRVLDCLKQHQVKATFFCTANFALHAPVVLKRIQEEGHEVASHGYHHSRFEVADLKQSKKVLEELTHQSITGYRQARMMPVSEKDIYEAGYVYNSSLNPTFIPGRYMNLSAPRTAFMKEGVWQIPTAVTPWLRFPLFWLSSHHLPPFLYRSLCKRTLRHDGYLAIYFHPWEFYDLEKEPHYRIPYLIRHNAGAPMLQRLNDFIGYFRESQISFGTYREFSESLNRQSTPHLV